MNLDKRTRKRMLAFCGQLHEDDGVDPRRFFETDRRRNKPNYKEQRLCRQVAETLGLAVASEFSDDRLHNLQVIAVDPASNASHLTVTYCTDRACSASETDAILARLNMVKGQLRSAVAAAITRKRTPKLVFRVVGPNESQELC